jgi:dienelactone hydrolase
MPDQFAGDIAPNSTNRVTSPTSPSTYPPTSSSSFPATDPESQTSLSTPSLLDRIKLGLADTAKSFVLDMWLARQTPEKVLPRLLKVIKAATEEYADALAHGDGLYAVGYCFGAKYVLILAGEDPEGHPSIAQAPFATGVEGVKGGQGAEGVVSAAGSAVRGVWERLPSFSGGVKSGQEQDAEASEPAMPSTDPAVAPAPYTGAQKSGPLVRAAAIAHGTLVTREDVRGVATNVPLCVVAVQDDPLFPEEVLEVGRKAWAANNAECKVEVFEGVPHGFAVVGEYEDQHIRSEQERAWGLMKGWLDGH